ncbi:hypothetical protein DPMN_148978 [Dreissena polymorpha]|uniref:Reverse transcriptase n=1 Tax=Dreissena polymorpha TaxID=45954 RepID=A0A9D4FAX6_DREPO|nr:hypothetical protein DPMN_148978 [Dreissena polymorpha]
MDPSCEVDKRVPYRKCRRANPDTRRKIRDANNATNHRWHQETAPSGRRERRTIKRSTSNFNSGMFRGKRHWKKTQSYQNGIRPDPLKVEAIRQVPRPKCVRDVRSILGAAGFYRRFCSSYSEVKECPI